MKRFLLPIAMLALAVVACLGAFAFGVWFGRFHAALEENKIAIINLDQRPNLNPQFREYLKARVYWNIRMFYPASSGYLIQKDWDRGAVNEQILAGVAAAKDPTVPILSWQSAIARN